MKRLAHSLQGVAVCQRERKRNGNMLKMQKSGGWMQHTGRFSPHYLAKHNVKHEVILCYCDCILQEKYFSSTIHTHENVIFAFVKNNIKPCAPETIVRIRILY